MMEKITEVNLDDSDGEIEFINIPDDYEFLVIYEELLTADESTVQIEFNGDTDNDNYTVNAMRIEDEEISSTGSSGDKDFTRTNDGNEPGPTIVSIEGYSEPNVVTQTTTTFAYPHTDRGEMRALWWDNLDVVTDIRIFLGGTSEFDSNSYVALYGVNKQ